MAKSKRSKIKMAYRTMRRAALQSQLDAKQREQAAKVYQAIGLPMRPSAEQTEGNDEYIQPEVLTRSHNGSDIISSFTPTPKGPTLNAVHGPLSHKEGMKVNAPLVGFPIVGAGTKARTMSGQSMDVDDDKKSGGGKRKGGKKSRTLEQQEEQKQRRKFDDDDDDDSGKTPYFYPSKDYKRSAIKKRRSQEKSKRALEAKRLKSLEKAVQMDVETTA